MNEVLREFNGLGQMVKEYQEHGGAVNTSTSAKVQYGYSEMSGGANHSRRTSMTYPNGKVLNLNYSTGINDTISRLSSLSDSTGTLESYEFLGLGTVVKRAHSQPGIDLTYIKQSGESNGDAGDQYIGLDRFDRVVDQRWRSSSADKDRFQYGYDRNSNRLWRDNSVNTSFGEVYQYDNLNQITSFKRGTLNSTKTDVTGSPSRTQTWDFDALGNFDGVTTDGNSQTRSHNKQNEITSISSATTPTYDANGNLTKDETGRTFEYDAWNRLVRAKNSGGTTIWESEYDALFRRVSTTENGTTTDFYFSDQWQVLEERVSGAAKVQYVWSPVYVDALVLRDRDVTGDSALEERLWVMQDANYNVTGLYDGNGNVVERYAYDPFGAVTVYDGNWGSRSGSSYGWVYTFQGRPFVSTIGAYNFRFRIYSPTLGRMFQNDPLGYWAGDASLYRMEGNGPIGGLDPNGLSEFWGGVWEGVGDLATKYIPIVGVAAAGYKGEKRRVERGRNGFGGAVAGIIGWGVNQGPAGAVYNTLSDLSGEYKNGGSNRVGERVLEMSPIIGPIGRSLAAGDAGDNRTIGRELTNLTGDVAAALLPAGVAKITGRINTRTGSGPACGSGFVVKSESAVAGTFQLESISPPVVITQQGAGIVGEVATATGSVGIASQGVPHAEISTGRTAAINLKEQLAMQEAKVGTGREIIPANKIGDPRFSGGDWAKFEHVHRASDGTNYTIHYMKNILTGEMVDFKFVYP